MNYWNKNFFAAIVFVNIIIFTNNAFADVPNGFSVIIHNYTNQDFYLRADSAPGSNAPNWQGDSALVMQKIPAKTAINLYFATYLPYNPNIFEFMMGYTTQSGLYTCGMQAAQVTLQEPNNPMQLNAAAMGSDGTINCSANIQGGNQVTFMIGSPFSSKKT